MTVGRHAREDPNDAEDDYVRAEIPDERVSDLAGREVSLKELAVDHAALLLFASSDTEDGRRVLHRVPAQLVNVPYLRVHTVLNHRSQLVALPPEARRQALFDCDRRTHQAWSVDPDAAVGAVLLGRDGLLAGGPVQGLEAVEQFANDIQQAIVDVAPDASPGNSHATDGSLSIDVLIPYRKASGERLRNLVFTIAYYRRHLPAARIIVAEQNDLSPLPDGVVVDRHITVPGDPDLFNRSLLLNAAAAESTAAHLVFADADCLPEVGLLASLEGIAELLPMTYIVPHCRVHYLLPASTTEFITAERDHDGGVPMADGEASHVTVGGVTFCSAELFQLLGGFDQQRFLGWGGEDDDLYNRCLVSPNPTVRIDSELLHLDHPATVWHSFSEDEMVAKRSRIPPPALRSPAGRLDEARAFFAEHRIALATRSHNPALFSATRRFSERMFPAVHVIDGTTGTYGLTAFLQLFADPRLNEFDYLVYSAEDNLIVDWPELRSTLSAFIEGGYGFAGMPDGGVISHRFHNPVAINPFLSFFDLRRVREVLADETDVSDRFGLDLVGHWPGHLVRTWDGMRSHPRVNVVLEEGSVPYGIALDDFEPYYTLWFRLLRAGLRPLYLAARDAPEMDDDGCCTAILGTSGRVVSYHTWFARAYHHDLEQTIRINTVFERARAHLRW